MLCNLKLNPATNECFYIIYSQLTNLFNCNKANRLPVFSRVIKVESVMDHNAVQSISILRDKRPEWFLGREGGGSIRKQGLCFLSRKISISEKKIRVNSYLVKYSIVNNTINALIDVSYSRRSIIVRACLKRFWDVFN